MDVKGSSWNHWQQPFIFKSVLSLYSFCKKISSKAMLKATVQLATTQ